MDTFDFANWNITKVIGLHEFGDGVALIFLYWSEGSSKSAFPQLLLLLLVLLFRQNYI
jgi:hypothetical protein